MKQLTFSIIFLLAGFLTINAQPSSAAIPDGFGSGSIFMADNTTLQGYIKNNLKKNGEIIFLSSDGKKIKYTASQVSGLTLDTEHYIVVNNTFYKVIQDGTKMKLLRKASNSSAIQYNGSEPVVGNADEGSYDDYFIQPASTKKLQLVRKKDFNKIFISSCSDCSSLTDDLKSNKLGFAEIEQAVTLYNSCNK